jgi:uncharacterized protein
MAIIRLAPKTKIFFVKLTQFSKGNKDMNKKSLFFASILFMYSLPLLDNHLAFSMTNTNYMDSTNQGKISSNPILTEDLKSAISEDNIDALDEYLNNFNTPNYFLHYAVNAGALKCVNKLLKRGANVNLVDTDNDGLTPLMVSAKYTYRVGSEMSLLLIRNGAKVNARAIKGSTPLMFASSSNADHYEDEYVKVVRLLIKNGAKVNVRNEAGDTPLSIAKEGSWRKIVAVLKKAGAKQ